MKLGELITGDAALALGLQFFHVSTRGMPEGALTTSAEASWHSIFFAHPVPGELTDKPDYLARRAVELEFEAARLQVVPFAPSRKSCLFASTSIQDARAWLEKPSRSRGIVMRLTPEPQAKIMLCNVLWFNWAVRVATGEAKGTIEELAVSYWTGKPLPGFSPKVEALIEGTVRAELWPGHQDG